MIRVVYEDDSEKFRALAAITNVCVSLRGRVVVFELAAVCAGACEPLRKHAGASLSCIALGPLRVASEPHAEAWRPMREAALAALRDIAPTEGPLVAWLELSGAGEAMASEEAAQGFYAQVELPISKVCTTLFTGHRQSDLPPSALGALLTASRAVIRGERIAAQAAFWLENDAQRPLHGADPTFGVGDPTQAAHLTAIGMMTAGIAHELANPLAITSSSLQYLQQRLAAKGDPAADFALAALRNVERMHGLLRDLLNFVAVRGPDFAPEDLNEVILEAVGFIAAECERRGIEVELALDRALPQVRMDARRIKQITLNLMRNALDAMATEGTRLRVGTHLVRGPGHAENGAMAAIQIENDGPGIPASALANLFRPFFTTKDGGTGLGLYLSRQNAKAHGGNIVAENLPRGVRFTVTLSLAP